MSPWSPSDELEIELHRLGVIAADAEVEVLLQVGLVNAHREDGGRRGLDDFDGRQHCLCDDGAVSRRRRDRRHVLLCAANGVLHVVTKLA